MFVPAVSVGKPEQVYIKGDGSSAATYFGVNLNLFCTAPTLIARNYLFSSTVGYYTVSRYNYYITGNALSYTGNAKRVNVCFQ